jgi:hypothetical protein
MRSLRAALIGAAALSMLLALPVLAYVLYGFFATGAIDTNLDGEADLSVCYGTSTNAPLYINRGQVDQEIERWHQASVGAFSSNAICNDDGSNIEILMSGALGPCSPVTGGIFGGTEDLGNTGYAQITVFLNSNCVPHFDWFDDDGIDAGKISALAVSLHEVGHALGLNHSGVANAVMHNGGPANCNIVGHDLTLAQDDASGYRNRYPGIDNTATAFPASAGCVD